MSEVIHHLSADQQEYIHTRSAIILADVGQSWGQLRDKKVLDLGTAAGILLIAASLHPNIDIAGIENDPGYYRRKKRDFPEVEMWKKFPPDEPKYVIGDAKKMPFHDGSFDVVISHAAPPTLPVSDESELTAVVSEIRRILKPGGQAYIFPGYFDLFVRYISSGKISPEKDQEESNQATIKTQEFLARNFSDLRTTLVTLPQQERRRPQNYMVLQKHVA